MRELKCPKCRRPLRMKVEMFIDAPVSMFRALSKKALRSRELRLEGTRWEAIMLYCARGHYVYRDAQARELPAPSKPS